jgi:hypothetical protein
MPARQAWRALEQLLGGHRTICGWCYVDNFLAVADRHSATWPDAVTHPGIVRIVAVIIHGFCPKVLCQMAFAQSNILPGVMLLVV